jgi:hypothetical protein
MKKTFSAVCLLLSGFAFAQGTVVNFTLNNDTAYSTNRAALMNADLPLQLFFTSDFNTKTADIIRKSDGQKLTPTRTFGAATRGIPKDGESQLYKIVINKDRTTNIDGNADTEFTLKIGNQDIPVKLKETKNENGNKDEAGSEPSKADNYQAGYIYYDALLLADPKARPQTKAEVLAAYGINASNYKENPYIKKLIAEQDVFIHAEGGGISSLLTGIGNTDVTYAAAGLARFIAERAKEELNEAFFKKMKEQLIAYPELSTAFPKTTDLMKRIESYSYASVIQALRDAFETDVRNLPDNLYSIKDLNKFDCAAIAKTDRKASCEKRMGQIDAFFKRTEGKWTALALFTAKEAPAASNPAMLLKSVCASDELAAVKEAVKPGSKFTYNALSALELSNLLSQSLLSREEERVWIDPKELNLLFSKKNAFIAYLGLVYAGEKNKKDENKITFYNTSKVTFQAVLDSGVSAYQGLEDLVKKTYAVYNTANSAIKKIQSAANNAAEADPQSLYNYYKTFTASIKPIVQSDFVKKYAGDSIEAKYLEVESYLTPSADLAYHISAQQYTSAIYDAGVLLNKLTESNDTLKPVARSFIKYGTFISMMATARSSDEVKKALEASALPMGSSAIKRNSATSIALNAYVGGFVGRAQTFKRNYEYVINPAGTVDTIPLTNCYTAYGLYAPIGVSFSFGTKKGWGGSIITQLVDVGALVSYYMVKGDQTALPSEFKVNLANVFAPGAQVGFNFPGSPFTLAFGGQYVPALYKASQVNAGAQVSAVNAWRTQVSLLVDIPLFNIKVKDFKK